MSASELAQRLVTFALEECEYLETPFTKEALTGLHQAWHGLRDELNGKPVRGMRCTQGRFEVFRAEQGFAPEELADFRRFLDLLRRALGTLTERAPRTATEEEVYWAQKFTRFLLAECGYFEVPCSVEGLEFLHACWYSEEDDPELNERPDLHSRNRFGAYCRIHGFGYEGFREFGRFLEYTEDCLRVLHGAL